MTCDTGRALCHGGMPDTLVRGPDARLARLRLGRRLDLGLPVVWPVWGVREIDHVPPDCWHLDRGVRGHSRHRHLRREHLRLPRREHLRLPRRERLQLLCQRRQPTSGSTRNERRIVQAVLHVLVRVVLLVLRVLVVRGQRLHRAHPALTLACP